MGFWWKSWKTKSFSRFDNDCGWGGRSSKFEKFGYKKKWSCDDRGRDSWHDKHKKKFEKTSCDDRKEWSSCDRHEKTKCEPDIVEPITPPIFADATAPQNHAPKLVPDGVKNIKALAAQMKQGKVIADVDATDEDGDTLIFKLSGEDADLFAIDSETGVVTVNVDGLKPFDSTDGDAIFKFQVVAEDSSGQASDTADFDVILFDFD